MASTALVKSGAIVCTLMSGIYLTKDVLQAQPHWTSKDGCRYRSGHSRIDILERFNITSRFAFYTTPKTPCPRVACDHNDVPSRYFIEDTDLNGEAETDAAPIPSLNLSGNWEVLLAQYTLPNQRKNDGDSHDGREREAMVTTIFARQMDKIIVAGYCSFSGRAVCSKVRVFVELHETYNDLLQDVTLYDFLN